MRKKSSRVRASGVSLVEVLVAAGILGVIAIAFLSFMKNSMKAQKGVEYSAELTNFGITLQQLMGTGESCSANLGRAPTPIQFDVTKDASVLQEVLPTIYFTKYNSILKQTIPDLAQPFIQTVGPASTYSGWTVSKIGLRNYGEVSPNTRLVGVEVQFVKKNPGTSFGAQTGRKQTTTLEVTTSGAGPLVTILGCGPEATDFQFSVGCANVYYPGGGWVAVGCPSQPFVNIGSVYYQGPTFTPPACPTGYTDQGTSVTGTNGTSVAGFSYSRSCYASATGDPSFILKMSCANLYFSGAGWATVGCPHQAFVSLGSGYWQGPTLNPPACPSGYNDLTVSVEGVSQGGVGGFVHSRICQKTGPRPEILKKECSNLYYAGGGWAAAGCTQQAFTDLGGSHFQGPTLSPAACPSGYSDLGISVGPALSGGGVGFTYSRLCSK